MLMRAPSACQQAVLHSARHTTANGPAAAENAAAAGLWAGHTPCLSCQRAAVKRPVSVQRVALVGALQLLQPSLTVSAELSWLARVTAVLPCVPLLVLAPLALGLEQLLELLH